MKVLKVKLIVKIFRQIRWNVTLVCNYVNRLLPLNDSAASSKMESALKKCPCLYSELIHTHACTLKKKLSTWFSLYGFHLIIWPETQNIMFFFFAREKSASFFPTFPWSICLTPLTLPLSFREEKSEQLLDTRQELENMEVELKRLQQEVQHKSQRPSRACLHTRIHMIWSLLHRSSLLFLSTLFLQRCQSLISKLLTDLIRG